MGGWFASDKASVSSTILKLDLQTGTELGNKEQAEAALCHAQCSADISKCLITRHLKPFESCYYMENSSDRFPF